MEQKKTLWIIAAVGVFLLVVLGAALIVYSPSSRVAPKVATVKPAEQPAPNGWSNPEPAPRTPDFNRPDANVQTPQTNVSDMFVVTDNATVLNMGQNEPAPQVPQTTTIDLNALKKEQISENTVPQPQQNINITVNLQEPDSDKVIAVQQTPVIVESDYYTGKAKEAETAEKEAAVKVSETDKPAAKTSSAAAPAKAAETTSTVKAAPKTTTSTKTVAASNTKITTTVTKPVTRFWVQVAAYGSKKAAEAARSTLSDKKITSDIYTYQDNKNNLFYRVRVGPFTTKSEAEYWKAKIVEIKDFSKAGSYVTSTTD